MRVNHIGCKSTPRIHGAGELRAQESGECEPGRPRGRNVLRHVASVRKRLIARGCISKSLDGDALKIIGWRHVRRSRRDNVNLNIRFAKRDSET